MSQPLWQPRTSLSARLLGAGFFAFGAALLGYQAKVIVDAVAAHAPRIGYFASAIILGEMAVVLGGYWMVRGLPGYTAVRELQTNPRGMRVLMIVSAVVGVVTVVGLRTWLGGMGYDE